MCAMVCATGAGPEGAEAKWTAPNFFFFPFPAEPLFFFFPLPLPSCCCGCRPRKERWSLEFLYSAKLVRCWAMTHSLGLVCVPVSDDGLGRQLPSYTSNLASSHD